MQFTRANQPVTYRQSHVYLFCFLFGSLTAQAQSPFVPLNTDYYHLIDRLEIRQNHWAEGFHSSVKPYNRQSIIQLTDSLAVNPGRDFSDTDYFNYDYLRDDSWEWITSTADSLRSDPFTKHLRALPGPGDSQRPPLLKVFYQKKADFYSLRTPDVDLHVNPVVYAGVGAENVARETGAATGGRQSLFVNTRGLEVRGTIGRKLGFYSFFADNQAIYPAYVQAYGRTYSRNNSEQGSAPGESFIKPFGQNGVDFLSARGYITFNALKIINIQFGHDRNFFGNGFRSLLLSDNSPSSLFMKFSTRLGRRIQYTNLFTQLQNTQAPLATPEGERLIPPKFAAMHHLSVNVTDHLNLGVFEASVFSRDRVDLSYLNPVILYRYIESSRGSADNVLIGIDAKYNFLSHFLVYTQLMLDEFRVNDLTGQGGEDWTNKFAWQLGAKYIDAFGVPNLDLQAELNLARPYTYAHEKSATVSAGQTNYANYSQPLAHPLGANFVEALGIVRFQRKRVSATGIFGIMTYGTDPPGRNYGGNILLDYRTLVRKDGNFIGQGRKNAVTYADLRGSYMIRHNIFLEGRLLYRYQDSQARDDTYSTQVASLALRWNLPYRNWVF